MRARGVVGRRIVAIEHERVIPDDYRTLTVVSRIVLDDGSILYPRAYETEQEPVGDIVHFKAKR